MIHFIRDDKYDILKVYENGVFMQQYPLGSIVPQKITPIEKRNSDNDIKIVSSANTSETIYSFSLEELDAAKCIPKIEPINDVNEMIKQLNKIFFWDYDQFVIYVNTLISNI